MYNNLGWSRNSYEDYYKLKWPGRITEQTIASDGTMTITAELINQPVVPKPEVNGDLFPLYGVFFTPKKIIINGPATIFFWKDGAKTVVKCMEGDRNDLYNAYCIAVTKRLAGSNSKIKSILKSADIVDQTPTDFEKCFGMSIDEFIKKVARKPRRIDEI